MILVRSGTLACAFVVFFLLPSLGLAAADTVTFDHYLSATNNDLVNNFAQNPSSGLYVQQVTGGFGGGSVETVPITSAYTATAVYLGSAFDFSVPGSTIDTSLDFHFDQSFYEPLAPGANASRAFRSGLVDATTTAFEAFGPKMIYTEGLFSSDLDEMLIVQRLANGPMQSTTTNEIALVSNEWYRLESTFENQGDTVRITGALVQLSGLVPDGDPILATWDFLGQNVLDGSPTAYAAFSGLLGGGVDRLDNFAADGPRTPVPEPATFILLGTGIAAAIRLRRDPRNSRGS